MTKLKTVPSDLIAVYIRTGHQAVLASTGAQLASAIAAGEGLIAAKENPELTEHGTFGAFCRKCGIGSPRVSSAICSWPATGQRSAHKSTGVHFLCWTIDNDKVQTWRPGDPVPEPFANPAGYRFVAHNAAFENAILQCILIPRYGFASA
jgi:hypothetical protein